MLACAHRWVVAQLESQEGATAIEYALIAALIAGVIVGVVTILGTTVVANFESLAGLW